MNSFPIILLLIIYVVIRYMAQGQQQKKEAAKRLEQAQRAAEAAAMGESEGPRQASRPLGERAKPSVSPSTREPVGSLRYESKEGRGFGGSMNETPREWKNPAAPKISPKDADPAEESGESPYAINAHPLRSAMALDGESVKKGFLYGEILGKPRALRR